MSPTSGLPRPALQFRGSQQRSFPRAVRSALPGAHSRAPSSRGALAQKKSIVTPRRRVLQVSAILPAPAFLATQSALPVLAAACSIPSLLGYWKREYTVSYGYAGAMALAGGLPLIAGGLPELAAVHAWLTCLYGVRLAAFLLWRQLTVPKFRDFVERIEERAPPKRWQRTPFIFSVALLYLGMAAPVVLSASASAGEGKRGNPFAAFRLAKKTTPRPSSPVNLALSGSLNAQEPANHQPVPAFVTQHSGRRRSCGPEWPAEATASDQAGSGKGADRRSNAPRGKVDKALPVAGLPEKLGDAPLRLIIVGHNPSEHAWRTGHYYSNPNNRMWPLLIASGIAPDGVRSAEDDDLMLGAGIGLTDVGTGKRQYLELLNIGRRGASKVKTVEFGVQHVLPEGWPLPSSTEVWVCPSTSGAAAMTNEARAAPFMALGLRLKGVTAATKPACW
eukprot:jgi/Tetstr1/439215/TSEL_027658.t1